ncbi:MAG TPA: glutathione peroxidase [candidate division Zixibacteria bacterium]|nr:glutathione peroxidase [candidate division Zixibacteria bacterium]
MKRFALQIATIAVAALATGACGGEQPEQTAADPVAKGSDSVNNVQVTNIQAIPFQTITGEETSLADFAGKVVLIVNVASKCGYTPQYEGLEKLYQRFADSGLVIIGFPANNFGGQEPGSNEEIQQFCTTTYGVTFPMMSKVSVKGDDQHPLFKALTTQADPPGDISWNFHKFLLDRNGAIIARFDTKVEPLSDNMVNAIDAAL